MADFFNQFLNSPIALFWAVVAFAWLWEDGALIGAALLAANGDMSVPLAVASVFVGICSGDTGLYYLGVAARRWRGLRAKLYKNKNFRKVRKAFKEKTLSNILLIRFVPGLRTVGFTMCGLWRIPFGRFAFAMGAAAIIWIALLFTLIYQVGASEWFVDSQWKWALGGVALCILIFNNVSFLKDKHVKNEVVGQKSRD